MGEVVSKCPYIALNSAPLIHKSNRPVAISKVQLGVCVIAYIQSELTKTEDR